MILSRTITPTSLIQLLVVLSCPLTLANCSVRPIREDKKICEINSISLMQESVNIAAEWTNNNDMKMNSEKSKEIIISYAHGNIGNDVPNILIDGKVVERVDHVKLLGITLSNDLTWKRHVDNIVKNAGKRIYMLYQLKRAGVNQADLITI